MLTGFNLLLWTTHLREEHLPKCETLKASGYDGVEIPVFEGSPSDHRAIGRRLSDMGLRRTAVGIVQSPEANPMSLNTATRAAGVDHLKWMVECCEAAGVEVLSGPFHQPLGLFTGTGATDRELDALVQSHREMAYFAASAGVKLSIEPLNRFECYALNTMKQSAELVRRVDQPGYGCLFDTFHANIEEKNFASAVKDANGTINHVHFSENDRGVPGSGHINYAAATQALKETGYDGWIVIEAFGQALADIAAATKVWRPLFEDEAHVIDAGIEVIKSNWNRAPAKARDGRIKLGMVGGGNDAFIGAVHRIAARIDDQYELVAGALSSTPEKSRQSGAALGLDPDRAYPDFHALLAGETARPDGIEAISIVTPNHMHFEPAAAFLKAGIHVLCEKPVTSSLSDAKKLLSIAEKSSALFVLTHNYTGYPMVRQAREMVANGDLGRVRVVQVEYPQDWLSKEETNKQADWRTDPSRSGLGGSIGDIGTHAFNLAEFISGLRVEALSADLQSFVDGRRLDDNAHVMLKLTGGARGMLWSSQVAPGNENALRIRIYGERGGLEWSQEDPNYLWYTPFGQPKQLITRGGAGSGAAAERTTRIPPGHPEGYLEGFANIYTEAARAIVAARDGNPIPEGVHFPSIQDGLRGVNFITSCVKSSDRGSSWVRM